MLAMEYTFIADSNVGKLARWLRMMGYDALFFNHIEDSDLVRIALREGRVILTRDTHIQERRLATLGRIKVILTRSDDYREQLAQVIDELHLDCAARQFTRCLECNERLQERSPEEVYQRVPPYVFKTQKQYMECPRCHRVYWRGTHWQRMSRELESIAGCRSEGQSGRSAG